MTLILSLRLHACTQALQTFAAFGNWWYFIFVPLVFLLLFLQVATAQLGMIVEKHNTIPAAM